MFFKKKNNEMTLKDKGLENVKMIPVPDIREYMIKGYEETKKLRKEKEELEQKLKLTTENAENFEKLYNATLVVSKHFEEQYNEANKECEKYKTWYENEKTCRKADETELKDNINILKEQLYAKEEELNTYDKTMKDYNENLRELAKQELKTRIIESIKGLKGVLSKEKVIKTIEEEN